MTIYAAISRLPDPAYLAWQRTLRWIGRMIFSADVICNKLAGARLQKVLSERTAENIEESLEALIGLLPIMGRDEYLGGILHYEIMQMERQVAMLKASNP